MAEPRLCDKDKVNLLGEIKEFCKFIEDMGVMQFELKSTADGEIQGGFQTGEHTVFSCGLRPEDGDFEQTRYNNV